MLLRRFYLSAGLFAGLTVLPLGARIGVAIGAALLFGVSLARYLWNERKLRAKFAGPVTDADVWIDCDAEAQLPITATPGGPIAFVGKCHDRKGHDGPHVAMLQAEWKW